MQIMVREHHMLHRQALILRAAAYPLNDKDRHRLKVCVPSQAMTGRCCPAHACGTLQITAPDGHCLIVARLTLYVSLHM